MTTTLFTNAHIATGEPGSTAASTLPLQDILVTDGVFTAFGPGLAQQYEAQGGDLAAIEVVDLGGKLVCPPFCDTHLHLDYVFTARKPGAVNESGTLFEGIQRWSETKSDLTVDEIKQRAKIGIKKEMLHGVQLIRSHADVTDPNLTSLKALLELKEELKDTVTLQIVSFPQEGMYSYEGPHGESGAELVEEGLKMGADCVGGIPHFEQCREFGEHSMHTVVELASKYDKLIDVHCDETDDPNSRYVELLSALAGPLVNLICGAAFCMQRPSFAAYSLMLGIYNLLPVWPLDGGRMIRCALLARLPITQAEHISEIVSFAACAVLLLIGVFLTFFRKSGLWPLGTAAYLTVRLLMLARRTDAVQ